MKSITIVTSSQPSTNPRALKEAYALSQNNFKVNFIYCDTTPWAKVLDENIINSHPKINWIKAAGGYSSNSLLYLYFRFRRKLHAFLFLLTGANYFLERSFILYFQQLYKKAKQSKSDLIVGHNLGTLPIVGKIAKTNKILSVFDFEDFHRGEFDPQSTIAKNIKYLEEKYIPAVDLLTASSSLISDEYKKLFSQNKIITIQNVFPKHYSSNIDIELPKYPLKLFWFSQFIGKKRGLEDVIEAMRYLPKQACSLTLLGHSTPKIKEYFFDLLTGFGLSKEQLIFLDPVLEKDIPAIALNHHIGVASEISHIPNRDLCLTNKIFMYLMAGIALLVSNTKAQNQFILENPQIGMSYEQANPMSITKILKNYIDNPQFLFDHRKNALEIAKIKFNWENEQLIFLNAVKALLY